MKIYTRTGDDGTTGLLGPGRVLKSTLRVEVIGDVDELNAALGRTHTLDPGGWLAAELGIVQVKLFHVGAELAAPDQGVLGNVERISDDDVTVLEGWIDRFEADLPPLTSFILPGGTPLGAELHLARTICRRAERHLVALTQAETVEPRLVRFLNRLADLLFVTARWCNRRAGVGETEWHPGRA